MTFSWLKLIHLAGVFTLFLAFGAIIVTEKGQRFRGLSLLHGVSLLVILSAGFGMLHELGIRGALPAWVIGKLAVWFLLGLALVPAKRKLLPRSLVVTLLVLLGSTAAFLALWKPGA